MTVRILGLIAATVLTIGSHPLAHTQATSSQPLNGRKLDITALAVNMSNVGTGGSAQVEFTIERWSTPADRQRLITAMLEKGPDALLQTLRKEPSHGRMRFPTLRGPDPLNARLGWDIRYATERALPEGGRRIVMALDRTIGFWEAANQPRTIDYPFTFIQIQVDREGKGEGKLSIATKVRFDKDENVIELETYASEPLRLQGLQVKERT